MVEINPDHPVTKMMHNNWHKIAALIMKKMGVDQIVITDADVITLDEKTCIIAHAKKDGLHVYLTDEETAAAMMNSDGRLAQ